MYQVVKDLAFVGKGAYHTPTKTLIIGDTHIGQESALQAEGVLVPRLSFEDLKKDTQEILDNISPNKIILNGDVKHNFGKISREEWDKTFKYISFLQNHAEVTIMKGNHDVLVEPLVEKCGVEVNPYTEIHSYFICHGDTIPEEVTQKNVIIGHEHPAVSIRSGNRSERYKCFLQMKYKDKNLFVLPSMNTLNEGSDVLSEKTLSPFISYKKEKKHVST